MLRACLTDLLHSLACYSLRLLCPPSDQCSGAVVKLPFRVCLSMAALSNPLCSFDCHNVIGTNMLGEIPGMVSCHPDFRSSSVQVAVGILLAAGLNGGSLSEGLGVAVIVMFCLFALGFAW